MVVYDFLCVCVCGLMRVVFVKLFLCVCVSLPYSSRIFKQCEFVDVCISVLVCVSLFFCGQRA
jgi:hypothetical protein